MLFYNVMHNVGRTCDQGEKLHVVWIQYAPPHPSTYWLTCGPYKSIVSGHKKL